MDVWTPITITVDRACELSSLSRSVIYELIGSKHIASIKVGKTRLINVASLRAFLEVGKE